MNNNFNFFNSLHHAENIDSNSYIFFIAGCKGNECYLLCQMKVTLTTASSKKTLVKLLL